MTTKAPPLTRSETILEQEEAAIAKARKQTTELRPRAEEASNRIQDAARILYDACEDYIQVNYEAEEIVGARGRKHIRTDLRSIDPVLVIRQMADKLVVNPPPPPLPRLAIYREDGDE